MKIYILEYVLEYLIDEMGVRWIIIIINFIFILILISPCGSTGWQTSSHKLQSKELNEDNQFRGHAQFFLMELLIHILLEEWSEGKGLLLHEFSRRNLDPTPADKSVKKYLVAWGVVVCSLGPKSGEPKPAFTCISHVWFLCIAHVACIGKSCV